MALNVGDKAPAFFLPTDGGGMLSLKDLKDKMVVLYFYPKDMTPGCTTEAQDFRDCAEAFKKAGGAPGVRRHSDLDGRRALLGARPARRGQR